VLDPKDLINPRCTLDHETPVQRESEHWFFDLPKLSEQLRKYIETNPNFPDNARNFSLSWIRDGLKPRSLTRDNAWGIPAPFEGARGKTIYVWMEAVLGYVSATKEWAEKKKQPSLWKKYWFDPQSRNVHFIGKDNIPFHVVIFPGLLLATRENYDLPWEVSSSEYIQLEGQKFSRSRKIGVWMDEAIELEEPEYWRYALISLRPEQKDTNFTWDEFERKVNTELNDVLGNFIHRTISFTQTHYKGKVPAYSKGKEQHAKILATLSDSLRRVDDRLGHFRLKEGLEQVVELAREGNRYLNEHEPWRLYKTDVDAAGETLGVSIQIVASLGILLQPFLPSASKKICFSLTGKTSLPWGSAGQTIVKPGTKIRPLQPLFHKVNAEKLRERLESIRSRAPIEAQA
jgi:methionyl-tRNA synthetase